MGTVRIIAGSLKGQRVRVPAGLSVRPTANKVREALFDILGPSIEGADVLDAFAGSGALGLEALSRGARSVTFLEADRGAALCIRRNVEAMAVESHCRLIVRPVASALVRGEARGPFDLVLADPPYRTGLSEKLLVALSTSGVLQSGARIVLERDAKTPPMTDLTRGLSLSKTARYGRACLDFYLFN